MFAEFRPVTSAVRKRSCRLQEEGGEEPGAAEAASPGPPPAPGGCQSQSVQQQESDHRPGSPECREGPKRGIFWLRGTGGRIMG